MKGKEIVKTDSTLGLLRPGSHLQGWQDSWITRLKGVFFLDWSNQGNGLWRARRVRALEVLGMARLKKSVMYQKSEVESIGLQVLASIAFEGRKLLSRRRLPDGANARSNFWFYVIALLVLGFSDVESCENHGNGDEDWSIREVSSRANSEREEEKFIFVHVSSWASW